MGPGPNPEIGGFQLQRYGDPLTLFAAPSHERLVARPVPGPTRLFGQAPMGQVEHEDARALRLGAADGGAAGDDLVIGMRGQNEN